jgi:hypothetical protein
MVGYLAPPLPPRPLLLVAITPLASIEGSEFALLDLEERGEPMKGELGDKGDTPL